MLNQVNRKRFMEEYEKKCSEIWELISSRLDQYGFSIEKLVELTRYSTEKIKRGISGEFEPVPDDFLKKVVHAFGLINNRTDSKVKYKVKYEDGISRDELIALLKHAPHNYDVYRQLNMLEDWGC